MARPALALLAQVSPLSGFLISSAPGIACFLAQPPPARNWIPERGSDGKGAPRRGCKAVLAAPGGGQAVRSHPPTPRSAFSCPACPGAGSEPIKSWNDQPPWLLPKAVSRPFLLLSPLLGMLFSTSESPVFPLAQSLWPPPSPSTYCPFLHKGPGSLLEAASSSPSTLEPRRPPKPL